MMYDGSPQYGTVKNFDGNSITTGDYDQQSLSVTTHVRIKENLDQISYGVCYGTNVVPTVSDKTISTTELDSNNDFTVILTKNAVGNTVYYRAYVDQNGVINYGETKSFKKELTTEIIDLGLSVNWASFNVGADFPADYGDYYAWGEIEPKKEYSWSTYKWCNGSDNTLTKYNSSSEFGAVDNKTTLDLDDDVAHVKWGDNWRMPTKAEQEELINNCTRTWYSSDNTEFNGVSGCKITSNIEGYTDRFIFIPATGQFHETSLYFDGDRCRSWSGSLNESSHAWGLRYSHVGFCGLRSNTRDTGLPVRPVRQSESWLATASIELSETTKTVIPNQSFNLHAVVKHNDEIFAKTIEWSSDNPAVATVDSNGKVSSFSKGTAHITASLSTLSAQCTIVVGEESDITNE